MVFMRVIKQGHKPEDVALTINIKQRYLRASLVKLGQATRDHMRNTLSNRHRAGFRDPRKKIPLSAGINVETTGAMVQGNFTVGVGNIASLDKTHPYWYIVNYGGRPAYGGQRHWTRGYWTGDPYNSNFIYDVTSPKAYSLPSGVKGDITAISYIEKAANWARTVWQIEFDKMARIPVIKTLPTGK